MRKYDKWMTLVSLHNVERKSIIAVNLEKAGHEDSTLYIKVKLKYVEKMYLKTWYHSIKVLTFKIIKKYVTEDIVKNYI